MYTSKFSLIVSLNDTFLQHSLFCQLIVKQLHSIGTILLHFLGHMPVYIQGKLSRRMPQIRLYGFDIVTGIQGRNCKAMAQVMEPGIL